jgi:hypothetical protein
MVNINPLTDEEKSYTRYDLDKLFRSTGYYKLYNSFEKLFKQVDLDLGTKFFDELKNFYEDEKQKRDKEKAENEKSVHPVTETPRQVEPEAKTEQKRVAPARVEQSEESIQSKLSKTPGWSSLTDDDKSEMLKYCTGVEGDKYSYKDGTSLIPCSCDKKINFPDSVWNCTGCGIEFS